MKLLWIPLIAAPLAAQSAPIDSFVRAEMERQRIPGVAVAVIHHGRVEAKGYGLANVELQVPVTPQTIFQSGSLGKMFTATAVMLLVEDGKLSLADTIARFFPDGPSSWRSITVRNLLNHTSGIPDYTTSEFDYRKDYTEDEMAKLAFAQAIEFPAGSRWNYSNTGYALLGFIIHKVSGKFYGDVLAERVFRPAGMKTARVISEADIIPNRAAGYRLVGGQLRNQEWVAPELNTTADGSLYWSLQDLIAWEEVVKRRGILKPESWNQILTPVRLTSGKTYPYGMGWSLDERGGKPFQEHGGSWQGFKTQLSRFLGEDLTVIVLANLAQADPARFADGIAALVNPSLAVPKLVEIPDRDPAIAPRITRLLDIIRAGKLSPADFAYVRAGFFPDAATFYAQELGRLGNVTGMALLDRKEIGDDQVYVYRVSFASGVRELRVAFAPDLRVAGFSLRRLP